MELIKQGDKPAFRVLYTRHSRLVMGYCLRMFAGNRSAAEDVAQEAWVKVARRADRYEARGTFKAWLMRIVRNEAIDNIRAQMPTAEFDENEGAEMDTSRNAEQALIDGSETGKLKEAVERLPAPQRAVLLLWISDEDLTYEQMATELGISAPAARSHLFRARKTLKERLGKHG